MILTHGGEKIKKIWIILMAFIILAPSGAYAWDDCPFGVTDCAYPGECSRYIDTNNDGICDHSQPAPTTGTVTTNTSTESKDSAAVNNETNSTLVSGENNDNVVNSKQSYYLLPITLILSVFYVVTHLMNKKGIIKHRFHKKIWNWIVTASFLVTGITGIELTLFINLGIHSSLNSAITFWHAIAAIVMVITSIFHIHMYWKSFKMSFKLFKTSNKPKKEKLKNLSPAK